jgi:TPR repeat protein
LAVHLEAGDGSPKNLPEAAKWYRQAADQGLGSAQVSLAGCYTRGLGVTNDIVEACKWLTLATAQKAENSTNALAILKKMMTPAQIAEAQRRASALQSKP